MGGSKYFLGNPKTDRINPDDPIYRLNSGELSEFPEKQDGFEDSVNDSDSSQEENRKMLVDLYETEACVVETGIAENAVVDGDDTDVEGVCKDVDKIQQRRTVGKPFVRKDDQKILFPH